MRPSVCAVVVDWGLWCERSIRGNGRRRVIDILRPLRKGREVRSFQSYLWRVGRTRVLRWQNSPGTEGRLLLFSERVCWQLIPRLSCVWCVVCVVETSKILRQHSAEMLPAASVGCDGRPRRRSRIRGWRIRVVIMCTLNAYTTSTRSM